MLIKFSKKSLSIIAVVIAAAIFMAYSRASTYAANTDVVINEIHYNPNTGGNQNFEFVELYNKSASPVDISGWCFTEGITFCFPASTSIAGHSYAVISPDPVELLNYYQVWTSGTYSGNLSNGGETLTLRDAANAVVSTFTYDDASPWPIAPDGFGPSLELKDPSYDPQLPESWGASIGAPTPNRVNSLYGLGEPPELANLNQLEDIGSQDTPVVTVEAITASEVELNYKVGFEADITLEMNDSGTNGDQTASDGTWSATLPAQDVGKLVRYRVEASNNGPVSKLPSFEQEALNYKGYVVIDPSQTSSLPIMQWFIDDSVYDDLMTNHIQDDVYVNCVIAYGNQVIDNSKVKIKGEISVIYPKKSLKFKLPGNKTINIPGKTARPLNEFHLNAEWMDQSRARSLTVWEVATEIGIDTPSYFSTRLLRNNQYHGLFFFFEKYEREYQTEKGMLDGWLFEDFYEKVSSGGSHQDIEDWKEEMLSSRTSAKREYVLEEHDIPNFINFMAFQALISNLDWYAGNNLFTYKDTTGSDRWSLLPYDIDLALRYNKAQVAISPYFTPYEKIRERFQTTALYDEPDLREMYYRRLRTLVDQYYSNDALFNKFVQNAQNLEEESTEDVQAWPTSFTNEVSTSYSDTYQVTIDALRQQKINLLARYRFKGAIPAAQVESPEVKLEEVESSSNSDEQYVKLKNENNFAVDISKWHIPEINFTFPVGAVVPSGGEVYIVRNDRHFKSVTPGYIVLGRFYNDLDLNGQLTLERGDESVSDTINYLAF